MVMIVVTPINSVQFYFLYFAVYAAFVITHRVYEAVKLLSVAR